MAESWNDWQGKVIDGFPLRQYLGGRGGNAVFLTEYNGQKAVIKVITPPATDIERQLSRLQSATKLTDRHLMRSFAAGNSTVNGEDLLYVVTEFAEEDLSQVLPVRALTAEEARHMLTAVVDGLASLHSAGFVHGHVKPANIMVVGEQIKLSSDGMCRAGERVDSSRNPGRYAAPEIALAGVSPASDVWSLGMIVVEALTQRLPNSSQDYRVVPTTLPEPMQSVARKCLHLDPQQRGTAEQILSSLRPTAPVPTVQPATKSNKWIHAIAVIVLAGAAMVIGARVFRQPAVRTQSPTTTSTAAPKAQSNLPPVPAATSSTTGAIQHQVVPDVPKSARNTVHGTIKLRVRVNVDASGKVVKTHLESAGPSKYFARLATQSAQQWKFVPPQENGSAVSSQWRLHYEFTRAGAKVQASPLQTAAR